MNMPTARPRVSVVMPCLNEAQTIEVCVQKARACFARMGWAGEVVVADNGSTDGSVALAEAAGARVVHQSIKGYGAALMAGISSAQSDVVVMGDADDSYDWSQIDGFVAAVEGGASLVIGNRFRGGIRPGAMPFLHRYLGNPVLSFLGRLFFRTPIRDFHCGMRAFRRDDILALDLRTPGMEFASEMIVKATLGGLTIREVPVVLWPDGRGRPPHLRTWRDGWRHLRFLLLFSPRWLFLWPGIALLSLGLAALMLLGRTTLVIAGIGLDVHSMAYAGAAVLVGFQMATFGALSRYVGQEAGWLPKNQKYSEWFAYATLERGVAISVVMFTIGLLLTFGALGIWSNRDFGGLDPRVVMRWVVPAVTAFALSAQVIVAAFFLEVLRMNRANPAHVGSASSAVKAGSR